MNTREQFGKYLLLKKLTEDSLGETFRAGLLGAVGMERVALLRVFNGQGLDGRRLWESAKERRAVQGVLRSPNIGEGIEVGEIQGIPYVSYEYISGKNMATLLEQAAKKRNYIPTEHALLITERVALALAAAGENRLAGQRILHGFLVPQLTMISNEGETRLLGFEVAPGLRGFAANPVIRQHFGRYLSPETLAGAAPDKSDDIYSLGVFLFELLTGRPLPPPGPTGYGSVVDQGVLATEQEPIPEPLRQLLNKTLVAREHRLDDVVAWHKTLNAWMFEGQYNPTTFNLAFFMHNLFRQEIERENQEIEVEKTLPLPVQKPEPEPATVIPPAVPAAVAPQDSGIASDKTENFLPEYAKDKGRSKAGLYAGVAVALGVVAALAVFVAMGRGDGSAEESSAASPPPVTSLVPEGPTEEELLAQEEARQQEIRDRLKELVDQQTEEMEAEIRQGLEDEINTLKRQRDDLLKETERRRVEAERQKELELQQELERQKAAEEEAARLAEEARKKAEAEEAARAAQAAKEAEAEKLAQAAAPPPPVSPPPPPPPPQVRRGDLVELGPGVSPPAKVRLAPRFPEMARRLRKDGATVNVKALIDENGKVIEAELVGEKVGYGFDNEALLAVKKGVFEAASVGGVPVKVWFNVKVEFRQ
jgi:TonB family protein